MLDLMSRHYSHFEQVIMRHGLDFFLLHVDIYFSQYSVEEFCCVFDVVLKN